MLPRHARALCGALLEARKCPGVVDPILSQHVLPAHLEAVRNLARQSREDGRPHPVEAADGASMPQNTADDEDAFQEPARFDLNYRSPTELLWPATRHQQRFAARVRDALQTTMMHMDSSGFHDLRERYGFTVVEVRMAPDNLTAFVLWDAFPDQVDAAQRAVTRRLTRLRMGMAKLLKAKHVPRLEFRRDEQSDEVRAVEQIFARLEQERLEGS